MIRQTNLPDPIIQKTDYPETTYHDACVNWPCYLNPKNEEFGTCQITMQKIKHTLAQTQRVCDYDSPTVLKQKIRQHQTNQTTTQQKQPTKKTRKKTRRKTK